MCLGLANGCTEPKEKTKSLLKRRTNANRIQSMNIDELTDFCVKYFDWNEICDSICLVGCDSDKVFDCDRKTIIKQWLESEVEE